MVLVRFHPLARARKAGFSATAHITLCEDDVNAATPDESTACIRSLLNLPSVFKPYFSKPKIQVPTFEEELEAVRAFALVHTAAKA